jgi:hypothetical protein
MNLHNLAVAFTITAAGCASHSIGNAPMPITEQAVVAFLNEFEKLAERENFALIRDMIDENAFFRFNDGDFVGRPAIQASFEKTWRGDPTVKKVSFYLTDIKVLTLDDNTATATYTYNWEGSQGDRVFSIRGRGTRVLIMHGQGFRIVHEHLSRFPRQQ